MKTKKLIILFAAVIILSLTAIPAAASEMSETLSEYMARLAVGRLYVPYYTVSPQNEPEESMPAEEENSTEESFYKEESSSLSVPDGMIAVEAVNLSRYELLDTPPLLLINETSYTADLIEEAKDIKKGAVLILHTHGTEAYLPDGVEYYGEGEDFRSHNEAETVVAVGEVFAEVLREAGLEVYHDTTMYDAADFENAYTASRAGARAWLSKHPNIRYIIDLHRDAVARNGKSCKTLCRGTAEPTAQVMLVIGTDDAGANHPGWEDNLALAASYQRRLNAYPTLARPVYLRKASYNQQLSPGAMLIEIGSAANTITEAKNAAVLAANAFVELISQN
ncbi:MAG: stage II sporulation protein P [Clostridia bacterium]|nr:stage II sporulation protein P [Clostridia bacterium]